MRPAWVGVALLVGCAPPEPPETTSLEPAIRIAYPPRDVQTVELQPDGSLEMLVVVDIDNLTLTSPYVEGIELVDGQGHWHATLGNVEGYQASFEPSLVFTRDAADVSPGITRLTVSIQSNLHDDLDEFTNWQSSIEFELVPFVAPADTGP
ncbi:MAG: hypothetical protein R3F61_26530 [Myxococcota bacterium]